MGGQVGETILEQMGGAARIQLMLGAQIVLSDDAATIRWPRTMKAKNGANAVEIKYDGGADLYKVTFRKLARKAKQAVWEDINSYDGIFCDQLVEIFERETALYLSIGRLR